MGGHVFGESPEDEYNEMMRVSKPGGMVILCPGTSLAQTRVHEYLVSQGFSWSTFEEPCDGTKRRYWKQV